MAALNADKDIKKSSALASTLNQGSAPGGSGATKPIPQQMGQGGSTKRGAPDLGRHSLKRDLGQ